MLLQQMCSDFYSCGVKSISLNINIVKLTCSIIRQAFLNCKIAKRGISIR